MKFSNILIIFIIFSFINELSASNTFLGEKRRIKLKAHMKSDSISIIYENGNGIKTFQLSKDKFENSRKDKKDSEDLIGNSPNCLNKALLAAIYDAEIKPSEDSKTNEKKFKVVSFEEYMQSLKFMFTLTGDSNCKFKRFEIDGKEVAEVFKYEPYKGTLGETDNRFNSLVSIYSKKENKVEKKFNCNECKKIIKLKKEIEEYEKLIIRKQKEVEERKKENQRAEEKYKKDIEELEKKNKENKEKWEKEDMERTAALKKEAEEKAKKEREEKIKNNDCNKCEDYKKLKNKINDLENQIKEKSKPIIINCVKEHCCKTYE